MMVVVDIPALWCCFYSCIVICWFVGIGFWSGIYAVDVSGFCGVVL